MASAWRPARLRTAQSKPVGGRRPARTPNLKNAAVSAHPYRGHRVDPRPRSRNGLGPASGKAADEPGQASHKPRKLRKRLGEGSGRPQTKLGRARSSIGAASGQGLSERTIGEASSRPLKKRRKGLGSTPKQGSGSPRGGGEALCLGLGAAGSLLEAAGQLWNGLGKPRNSLGLASQALGLGKTSEKPRKRLGNASAKPRTA